MAWVIGFVLLSTWHDRLPRRLAARVVKAGEADAARSNIGTLATAIVERVLGRRAS